MGKVKVKIIGDETAEQEQLAEQKKRREAKSAFGKKAKVKGVGLGGGQRINTIGVSEEDVAEVVSKVSEAEQPEQTEQPKKAKKQKSRKTAARVRSKRYEENKAIVAKGTLYSVKNGIEIMRKFKNSKFDETVELHVNVKEQNVAGSVDLPHGTGKELKIVVADDTVIAEIEKGKINFDILVAHPSMMPQLAKVARVLGPRGLMPNPKAGTISEKPEDAVKKLSAGQINFKTEAGGPTIHMRVGKVSFKDNELEDNIKAVLDAIGTTKIENATLKSTMSPGIKIQA